MLNGFGILFVGGKLRYFGFFKDDCRDGLGIYRLNENCIYIGYWKQSTFNGNGVLLTHNNAVISGKFSDDANCKGTVTLLNGEKYDGQIKAMKHDYRLCSVAINAFKKKDLDLENIK